MQKQELEQLYWGQCLSLQKIGELCGVTAQAIWYQMKRHGIPRRSWHENPHLFKTGQPSPRKGKRDLSRPYNKYGSGWKAALIREEIAKCQRCGHTDNLVVHHKNSSDHRYDLHDVEVLCRSCHAHEHKVGPQ